MKIQIMQQLLPLATGMMTLRYQLHISELTVEPFLTTHVEPQRQCLMFDEGLNCVTVLRCTSVEGGQHVETDKNSQYTGGKAAMAVPNLNLEF